jgi:hypothetical protein
MLLTLLATLALAGVTATIDRTEIAVGDRVRVDVVVDGDPEGAPSPPPVAWGQLASAGQSTSISFVNGRQSRSVTWSYLVVAEKPGTFELGSFSVRADGTTQASAPLRVVVKERGSISAPTSNEDVYLTASVSDDSPVVGQQIIMTLRLFRRARLADARLELPEVAGATFFDVGEQREYEATVGNRTWQVTELRKGVVVQQAGDVVLPPARVDAAVFAERKRRTGGNPLFDDMFGRADVVRKTVSSEPIALSVAPLPPGPPDASGLVGAFTLTGSVSRTAVEVGGAVTLELVVQGSSNPALFPAPIQAEADGLRVYDEAPIEATDTRGAEMIGTRTFKRSFVAQRPGALEIPAARLVVFDATDSTWKTLQAGPWRIDVTGDALGDVSGAVGGGRAPIQAVGRDISRPRSDAAARTTSGPNGPLWLSLLFVPSMLAGAWSAYERRRVDPRAAARAAAPAAFRAALAAAPGDDEHAREAAVQALRVLIRDMFGRATVSDTAAETERALAAAGAPPSLVRDVTSLLERSERARYGGGSGPSVDEVEQVATSLVAAAPSLVQR